MQEILKKSLISRSEQLTQSWVLKGCHSSLKCTKDNFQTPMAAKVVNKIMTSNLTLSTSGKRFHVWLIVAF